jgi:hypothetical protein
VRGETRVDVGICAQPGWPSLMLNHIFRQSNKLTLEHKVAVLALKSGWDGCLRAELGRRHLKAAALLALAWCILRVVPHMSLCE